MNAPTFNFRNIDVAEELAQHSIPDLVSPTGLIDRLEEGRTKVENGIKMPWGKLDGVLQFREGELIILGSYSGHYKSTIANQIGLSALRQGYNVGVASLELPAEDVLGQYSEFAAGRSKPPIEYVSRLSSWCNNKLVIYDRVDAIAMHEAIQLTIALIKFTKCKLIVLDCLFMMGVDRETEASFVKTLKSVAGRFRVSILLVHHVRKSSGQDGEKRIPDKADLLGDSHLVNTCHTLLFTWHNK